jgi:hypothetical protein
VTLAGFALLAAALSASPQASADGARWEGLDEKVVERVAADAGHPRWRTFLDGSGDLPLFLFLSAGIAGGFALGYGYRAVFGEGRGIRERNR